MFPLAWMWKGLENLVAKKENWSAYGIRDFWAIGTNCRGELEWETVVEEWGKSKG